MLVGDESVQDPRSAFDLASGEKPYGIYNIKLMKCGGIVRAREIAAIAQLSGIALFWGCNDESVLSIAAGFCPAPCGRFFRRRPRFPSSFFSVS